MKKTYINPQLEVIKIATQQMLADSTTTLSFGEEQTADKAQSRMWEWEDFNE